MKGIKLLLAALLCLVTTGAGAKYTYNQGAAGIVFHWVNSNESTTVLPNTSVPAKTVNINNIGSEYTFQLTDQNRGLVYFLPSLYGNTYTNCYVGIATDYKNAEETKVENADGTTTTYPSKPVTSVEIPDEITINYTSGGQSYSFTKKITAIVDYGFTTSVHNDEMENYDWTYTYNNPLTHQAIESTKNVSPLAKRATYYNPHLKKVTFTTPSYVQLIGWGAFQGCINLESIVIPSSVTGIYREAFTYCKNMKTAEFQTTEETDATTGITTLTTKLDSLPINCFYMCNSLEALDIPEGITEIHDCALQDCWSLKEISLPSTLTTIGEHFLCRALSLTSFYLPASVTTINAAFLHGCENMRDVYLMGDAAVLESGSGTSKSFYGENTTTSPSVYGVNNCTFHVMAKYSSNYTTSSNTWYDVWDGGTGDPKGTTWGYQGSKQSSPQLEVEGAPTYNRIVWPTGTNPEQYNKDFGPYKWQSVIFYNDMSQDAFKSEFGNDALIAQFTGCTKESTTSKHYTFQFETISGTIKGKTPYMIYVGEKTVKHEMYDLSTLGESDDFRTFYAKRYNVSVPVTVNGTATGEKAVMVGLAVPIPFSAGDFSFQWKTNSTNPQSSRGVFRGARITGQSGYKGRYSCLWNIVDNGTKLAGEDVQVSSAKSFTPMATGINGIHTDIQSSFDINIYDLSGRLVGTSRNDLPRGMYIQGGKKFIKK